MPSEQETGGEPGKGERESFRIGQKVYTQRGVGRVYLTKPTSVHVVVAGVTAEFGLDYVTAVECSESDPTFPEAVNWEAVATDLQKSLNLANEDLSRARAEIKRLTSNTWRPPGSLRDGIYSVTDLSIIGGHYGELHSVYLNHDMARLVYSDYVKPSNGKWKVERGTATYLGKS